MICSCREGGVTPLPTAIWNWTCWSALRGCSVPRPQRADIGLSQTAWAHVLKKYLFMFFPVFHFISDVPFRTPPLSFLSLFLKCTLSGGNETIKCIPIIPSLEGTGFYVTHCVLIHLRNVYVLTACQPWARYWGRMDGGIIMVLTPLGCCEDDVRKGLSIAPGI